MQHLNTLTSLIVALAAVALVACGDESDDSTSTASNASTSNASTSNASTSNASIQQVVRVSASAMTEAEIDRFQRAFSYAVSEGWMDDFCDTHGDHTQRHHGAELMPDSPLFLRIMSTTHGHRLLPWHRAFVLEAEIMLQAALKARNMTEGLDPTEGDLVFIPYWDAAHDQGVPAWVDSYLPMGGTAVAPENLPEGHAGHGNEGERYNIVIGRWPGTHPGFPNLAAPDQIGRILDNAEFENFYKGIDFGVEIQNPDPAAQAALDRLSQVLPDNSEIETLTNAIATGVLSNEEAIEVINAFGRLGYDATVALSNGAPEAGPLEDALEVLTRVIKPPPHALMHLWSGGLDPTDSDVRGTLTYFHELCVDPLFWMLHTELDRYWFTWSQTHSGGPPLEGDDAMFHPISEEVGAAYGGGRVYTLEQLSDVDNLPFTYDSGFVP